MTARQINGDLVADSHLGTSQTKRQRCIKTCEQTARLALAHSRLLMAGRHSPSEQNCLQIKCLVIAQGVSGCLPIGRYLWAVNLLQRVTKRQQPVFCHKFCRHLIDDWLESIEHHTDRASNHPCGHRTRSRINRYRQVGPRLGSAVVDLVAKKFIVRVRQLQLALIAADFASEDSAHASPKFLRTPRLVEKSRGNKAIAVCDFDFENRTGFALHSTLRNINDLGNNAHLLANWNIANWSELAAR